MPSLQRTITIVHRQGLHARPAALFVQVAKRFTSSVVVKKGRKRVDGRSIMGLLTLAAEPGSRVSILVDGDDAQEALDQLSRMLIEPLSDTLPRAPSHHVP